MIFPKGPESSNEFASSWLRDFKDYPPLAYVLRGNLTENWTRFHALPKSKRYADSDWERQIILSRANALAEECFGDRKTLWLVTQRYGKSDVVTNSLAQEEHMTHVLSWLDEDENLEDQYQSEFWATKVAWNLTSLDKYFAGVAEEEYCLVLYDPATSTVLAPYDGGFDIFSFRTEFLTAIEEKYGHWMSERPDKL
jgi:hypothetical protein